MTPATSRAHQLSTSTGVHPRTPEPADGSGTSQGSGKRTAVSLDGGSGRGSRDRAASDDDQTTPAPVAAVTPPSASVATRLQTVPKELHIAKVKEFYEEVHPANVGKEAELYAKYGPAVWQALEKKYPGRTGKYTKVSCVGFFPQF